MSLAANIPERRCLRYVRVYRLHIGRRAFAFPRSLTPGQQFDGIKDKIRASFELLPVQKTKIDMKALVTSLAS